MFFKIILISVIVIFLVLTIRGVFPLDLKKRYKLLGLGLVIIMCSRAFIDRIVGGSFFDPNLSRTALVLFNASFCTALAVSLYCIVRDICNIPVKVFHRSFKATAISTSSLKLFLCVAVFFFCLSTYACFNAWMQPRFNEHTLYFKNLPSSAEGYRIAVLSDMHINRLTKASEVEDYVNRVNACRPDLILIAGDFQDGTVSQIGEAAQQLYRLQAADGVFACEGNHEIYWDYEQWKNFYSNGGIRFLDNNHIDIHRSGQIIISVAGVLDTATSLEVLATAQNARKESPLILLSHRPGKAQAADGIADLVLSGHTHGGMAPGLNCLVAMANNGYVAGEYELERGTRLWVSRGTSMWQGFALRLFDDAEILIFELKTQK